MNLAAYPRMNVLSASTTIPPQATAAAYGRYAVSGEFIHIDLAIHDLRTQQRMQTVSAAGQNLASAVEALARQIDPQARHAGPRNEQALRAYVEGLRAEDAGQAAALLDRAIEADPHFGRAYVAALQIAMQRNDRAAAERILSAAAAQGDALPARDRAKLALDAATIRGDHPGRLQGLIALAGLHPNDPGVQFATAEFASQLRRYREAIDYFRRGLALQPNHAPALNGLGYTLAHAGDLEGAKAELEKYRQLEPANPNPLDSMGDAHYHHARFGEAAQFYLESHAKNPSFLDGGALLKAARARLLAGDLAAADQIFERYRELRKTDPLLAIRQAEWDFMSGRTDRALQGLEAFGTATSGGASQLAFTNLAICSLYLGERDRARGYAAKGARTANFLAQPSASPQEWEARISQFPLEPRVRDELLGLALLFDRQFAPAQPVLQRAYEMSSPFAAEGPQVLYAWALVANGHGEAAKPLLDRPPIPQVVGVGPFSAIYVAKIRELRTR